MTRTREEKAIKETNNTIKDCKIHIIFFKPEIYFKIARESKVIIAEKMTLVEAILEELEEEMKKYMKKKLLISNVKNVNELTKLKVEFEPFSTCITNFDNAFSSLEGFYVKKYKYQEEAYTLKLDKDIELIRKEVQEYYEYHRAETALLSPLARKAAPAM